MSKDNKIIGNVQSNNVDLCYNYSKRCIRMGFRMAYSLIQTSKKIRKTGNVQNIFSSDLFNFKWAYDYLHYIYNFVVISIKDNL